MLNSEYYFIHMEIDIVQLIEIQIVIKRNYD